MNKYFETPFTPDNLANIGVLLLLLPALAMKIVTLGAFQVNIFLGDVAKFIEKTRAKK